MIELLAQITDGAAQLAAEPGRFLGLSVMEWGLLLGFVSTFIGAVLKHLQASRGERKVEAVIAALEETSSAHPEAMRLAKRLVRDKATKLGVEVGHWGLEEDVRKVTRKLRRLTPPVPAAPPAPAPAPPAELGPDDPTPNPDEATP